MKAMFAFAVVSMMFIVIGCGNSDSNTKGVTKEKSVPETEPVKATPKFASETIDSATIKNATIQNATIQNATMHTTPTPKATTKTDPAINATLRRARLEMKMAVEFHEMDRAEYLQISKMTAVSSPLSIASDQKASASIRRAIEAVERYKLELELSGMSPENADAKANSEQKQFSEAKREALSKKP